MPNLRVIIVNWNSGELLRSCLRSFAQALSPSYRLEKIVIVDNASTDGSAEDLHFPELPLEVITNPANLGFAKACNQGADGADADYLLFLNPDMLLSETSLAEPLSYLEKPENSGVGIVGIQLVDGAGEVQRTCARFPTPGRIVGQSLGLDRIAPQLASPHFMREWPHDRTAPVDQVMGAFLMVRRRLFEALHGFDERFFVYYDDVDLCLRARQAGWQTVYLADARAMHLGGGTTAAIPDIRLFYGLRSRVLFAHKHFGPAGFAATLLASGLLEPLTRLARAAGRGSMTEMRHVATATAMLYGSSLRA